MACLDHLVIVAPDLAQGVSWCEQTLGVTPGPGGAHPLMGTHNRLIRIDSPAFTDAYLEIIAIDPMAMPQRQAPLKRWFDMDDAAFMQDVRTRGPRLAHWVARVDDLTHSLSAWSALGIDRGRQLAAQRDTPQGLLSWQISVRDDGQRLMAGCLPTLIQWGARHPAHDMPRSALSLKSVQLQHPQAGTLKQALSDAGFKLNMQPDSPLNVQAGSAHLSAVLQTPRGEVILSSLL